MKVLLCNLGRQTEHGALEVGTGCAIAQNHIGHTNQHLTGVDSIFWGIDVSYPDIGRHIYKLINVLLL